MADSSILEEDAGYFARLAVQYDSQNCHENAKFFYMVSIIVQTLRQASFVCVDFDRPPESF